MFKSMVYSPPIPITSISAEILKLLVSAAVMWSVTTVRSDTHTEPDTKKTHTKTHCSRVVLRLRRKIPQKSVICIFIYNIHIFCVFTTFMHFVFIAVAY